MFKGKTILERKNSKEWIVRSNLTFQGKKYTVTITDGLTTDGASIPKIFWSIIGSPLTGKYIGSALIHDGLYATHKLTRKETDDLFKEMMKDNGVNIVKRNIMFLAVRIGGYFVWPKTPEELAEFERNVYVERREDD